MKIEKTKKEIIFIGLIVLIMPIFFLNYALEKLYLFSESNIHENMNGTLLEQIQNTSESLEPVNYLNNEFQKLHRKLFPKLPEETINVVLEKEYADNLYTKELLNTIASETKNKFSPITITVATNQLTNYYAYICPELKKQITKLKMHSFKEVIDAKTDMDISIIADRCKEAFITYQNIENSLFENYKFKRMNEDEAKTICYNYFSRYSNYYYSSNSSLHTDYFGKQQLFPIYKYTCNSKGIYGFYSLLIPQSHIDPEEIINTAISQEDPEFQFELENKSNNNDITNIKKDKNGFYYLLDFPTNLINQINAFKRLRKIDKSYLLNKQIKITLKYPKELIIQKNFNNIAAIISIFLIILYFIFSYNFIKTNNRLRIALSYKLILVLSVIIFIPILGTAILIWIPSQSIHTILENHITKSLKNEINNLCLKNDENNYREIAYANELKRRISNSTSLPGIFNEKWPILTENDTDNWFLLTSGICFFDEEGTYYYITDRGTIRKYDRDLANFHLKHTENLGLITKPNKQYLAESKASTFTMAFAENYIFQEKQEIIVGQESVVNQNIISLSELHKSIYIYCQDANNKPYYLLYKRADLNWVPFRYLYEYINKYPFWYRITTKFADLEMVCTMHDHHENLSRQWPVKKDVSQDINKLLNKTVTSLKNIGQNSTKSSQNETKINIWHYKPDDAFAICGIARTKQNPIYVFYIFVLIPVLIAYTTILLIITTGFISVFIKEPMNIYKEGIHKLENNQYGIKISSFSKDEFNNITIAFNKMSEALRQKEQIKRYVSHKLIESVENNNIQNAGEGKLEKITVLSSDIRNFTGTSEKYSPAEIVEMLNSYFTLMQQAISEQGGIIDKYIGDAIQAVFYDEPEKESRIIRACKAALAMREALKRLNQNRSQSGLFAIENGIGIDSDIAITGTIGTSHGRKDYSVNGAVIDKAANIEAKTKNTKSKILISKSSFYEVSESLTGSNFDEETVELIDVRK